MFKLKCIIIEDEPLAVKVLADYIAQVPFLQLAASFKDALLATEWLRSNEPDVIFLDIHLPKLKGMAFLKTLSKQPAVIITTAYHQYAVEGFELDVTDYLLKPFGFERFLAAVNKVAMPNKARTGGAGTDETKAYLFLTVQKKKVKVLFSEILYIESQREYVKVVTENGEHLCRMSSHEIEAVLPNEIFKRVHRSFIISVPKVLAYTAESIDLNGISIPVGRAYREVVENF